MYNPAKVEKMNHAAQAAFEKKDYPEAIRIFEQVVSDLEPLGLPALTAEARNNLSVALLKNGAAQAALDQASGTDKIFAEGGHPEKQAVALGNQAAALAGLGRSDEALEKYQQSSELFKQLGNSELRGFILREISVLQMKRGKQVESLFTMDAALESVKKPNWREAVIKKLMHTVHNLMGSN